MDRKIPCGWTLSAVAIVAAALWLVAFLFPIFIGGALLATWVAIVVLRLVMAVRDWLRTRRFKREYQDFLAKPLIPAEPRDENGKYQSRKALMAARLRAEIEARKAAQ